LATWIAFFRGINVGGNNLLPMKGLVALLQKLGFADVQTYIQSGNAVFRSNRKSAAAIEKQIVAAVSKTFGFESRVLLLSAKDLGKAIAANPFPHGASDHKSLHLYFLATPPKTPSLDALNALKASTESFLLSNKVFYLHAPDGIGKSKLAVSAEKLLGVAATARNWRTVLSVQAMVHGTK